MDYDIKVTPKDGYIHVEVSGEANYARALEMWQKVIEICNQHQCYKILGEQNLKKTLSTSEAIDYPKLFKKAGVTESYLIAWVDHNPRTRDTTEFIRDILTNRFIGKGKLFKSLEDAKKWLLRTTDSKSAD